MNAARQLVLLYDDRIPGEFFDEFKSGLVTEDFEVGLVPRSAAPMAGLIWYLPPVVAAILMRDYFKSFMSEMGKDHYGLLKKGLAALYRRVSPIKVTIIGTPGKVLANQPFSLVFSVMVVDQATHRQFKLMLPNDCTDEESAKIIEAFLAFAEAYFGRELPTDQLAAVNETRAVGNVVLFAFDVASGAIKPFDGLADLTSNGN